ncbi:hypothetical protein [Sphingopyxis witflariensis]|uniref:hypothetical protein n=1 Tax=Sphingopyxis witflariensis TaxID=173675 RepID=UPI001181BFE8|nr:hypothetical protein [Sphingopyxis witflariensis]
MILCKFHAPVGVAAILSGFLLHAVPALSQTGPESPVILSEEDQARSGDLLKEQATNIVAGGASSSSTFGNLARSINIETSGTETTASVSFGFDRSHPLGGGVRNADGSTRFRFATDSIGIVATAPLGKNDKPSLFDFDKLGDGTSLSISAVRYVGSVNYQPASSADSLPALQARLQNRCIDAQLILWVGAEGRGDTAKEALARLVATELRAKVDRMKLERGAAPEFALGELAKSEDARIKALAGTLLLHCVEVENNKIPPAGMLATYGTDEEKAAKQGDEPTGLWFFGGRGKIARTNYEYLVQTPLSKTDVSHTGYKIEAFGGRVFDSGRKSLTGSFAYSRAYTAQDEVQLCEPNGVGTQIACFTGPLGAPARANRYTLAGEFRWLVPLGALPGDPSIGFAPRVSYEIKSNSAWFELPVYFAPNSDKALNGGLRFAFDTEKDDFAFGLFVGVPFSVFTN